MPSGISPANQRTTTTGRHGFTVIELMTAVVIIGILIVVGIANFMAGKKRALDVNMKSDLRSTMMAIEDYTIQYGELPPNLAAFQAANVFQLSQGVVWDRFTRELNNGVLSIHIHLAHPQSPNKWHAHYPAQGSNIERR